MANIPDDLWYTEDHEYVRVTDEPTVFEIGITDYAQGELGDIVFVNLPKVGESFDTHGVFGTIEAVKAVSDLYCPLSGKVVAINRDLDADPAVINSDPYGAGWMVHLRVADPSVVDSLLTPDAYRAHIGA